jgi:acyl-homoserine lactone acylase PvdQ
MATQSLIETYRRREAFYERQIERNNWAVADRLTATREWLKVNDPDYIWE